MRLRKEHSDPTYQLAIAIVHFFVLSLASSTILTLAAQLTHISFSIYSYLIALAILGCFYYFTRQLNATLVTRSNIIFILIAVGLAYLSLYMGRADSDDYFYLPNAVHYLTHPEESMGFDIHFLATESPIISVNWGTSITFEYYQAAMAHITGISFLKSYYVYHAAWIFFLLPFTLYIILRRYVKHESTAIIAVVFVIGVIMLMGETHRTPGTFLAQRFYQGKTGALFILIPLFYHTALTYLKTRKGFFIFLIPIAACGATSSSIVLLPPLMLAVFVAYHISSRRLPEIKYSLLYFSSYAFPFLYACLILLIQPYDLGVDSPVNKGWPTHFAGHFDFLFSHDIFKVSRWNPTFWLPLLSWIIILLLANLKTRIFLSVWIIMLVLTCFNPVVADVLIHYFFGPNVYWRLFYIFPLIPLIGAAYGTLIELLTSKKAAFVSVSLGIVLILNLQFGVFGRFENTSAFSTRKVSKLTEQKMWYTKYDAISSDLRGTLLAPYVISGAAILRNGNVDVLIHDATGIFLWLPSLEAQRRDDVKHYLETYDEVYFSSFTALVSQHQPKNIILSRKKEMTATLSFLKKSGYKEKYNDNNIVLLIK